jgi:hypothetical protein
MSENADDRRISGIKARSASSTIFVIPNSFRDNKLPSLVILKQVQDDES